VWSEVCEGQGIEVYYTAPYAPWSNPAERVMRDIGDYLRMYTSDNHKRWYKYVPEMEINMNNTVHTETGIIPEICVQGQLAKWPFGEGILQISPKKIEEIQKRPEAYFEKKLQKERNSEYCSSESRTLKVGDYVLVRNHTLSNKDKGINSKLNPRYRGLYQVIEEIGNNRYRLRSVKDDDIECEQHVKHLVKYRS